ncbi:DNA-binding domain-containing protein, partial [Amnimonas aquatica]
MPSAPDFRQQQRQFTAWLRHPGTTPAPADIEPRRLEIYRDLLRNNVTSFVDITFPVAGAVLPATLWARLKEGFFADFHCTSPL